VQFGDELVLQSTNDKIKKYKQRLLGDDLASMMKAPVNGSQSINAILIDGLVELCKVKPVGIDAVQWLGEWLLANNPSAPMVEEDVNE
jgi:hypothetical protein